MSGGLQHLILSGPVLLAIPVAAAAGAVTFLSPCCLPLVPGYLSYLTGMSGAAATDRRPETSPETSTTAAEVAAVGTAGSLALASPAPGGITSTAGSALAGAAARPGNGVADRSAGTGRLADAGPVPRGRVMLGTLLFVLGFSVLYAVEGVTVSGIGGALLQHKEGLTQILGGLIIVLGTVVYRLVRPV